MQLPDNLAGYDTLSYVKMKHGKTEMWGTVTRWRNSSFSSSHLSGKKQKIQKSQDFSSQHTQACMDTHGWSEPSPAPRWGRVRGHRFLASADIRPLTSLTPLGFHLPLW